MKPNAINENAIDGNPLRGPAGDPYQNWKAWELSADDKMVAVKYISYGNIYYLLIMFMIIGFLFIPPLIENSEFWLVGKISIAAVSFIFLMVYYGINKSHARKGDWLIYQKDKECIKLPRENIELCSNSLVCLQIIIGDPCFSDSLLDTQLNIIFQDGTSYRRYPLMRALTPRMLWGVAMELSGKLSCPCQVVEFGFDRKCKKRWETGQLPIGKKS